ncbi:Na+/H+ antiporter subunit A [Cohnella sp. LGH]|uniref:Na+/H+ antiporter subunit A n=1 Tax=Cohnella sp. LGH TaxID=1619153 RepID=UPI001ADA12B1|nr:Na+/H+ antiporter subunit A [Cohnella sp. LGH]QTH45362.1 Na+/H+ antiporter subunit A [Cohnella sp. LGH]
MSLLHSAILIPLAWAVLMPLFGRRLGNLHAGWLVLPIPIVLFVYFCMQLPLVSSQSVMKTLAWMPSIGLDFTVYLDGLSLIFALLISGIGSLVVLYSTFYLDKNKEAIVSFYTYLLIFMGAMLGIVLSDNLIVLYGFWELTSISSFLLIAFWHQRQKSQYGAQKSMLITVFGGLAMLAGIILLYVMTGTFSIREIIPQVAQLADDPLIVPTLMLILLGAFTKSAQFPFHIWLPDAMEAPTPVSAYLHSATMVKAGLYLVARLTPVFAVQEQWFWLISGVGLITLIYGSLQAIKQKDLKAMLAYSTISQLGLIMCLLGLGSAAVLNPDGAGGEMYAKATAAALFHLLNHAMFKGALFMVVGIVDHETGTRDLRKLGGLMALMPVTFTIAVIGAGSMAGLPPFNGFLSKEMFFTAVLQIRQMSIGDLSAWGGLVPVVAWIASVFTFIYSMVLLTRTFGGKLQSDQLEVQPHEAPMGLLFSPVVLASLVIVTGLFPNLLGAALVEPAMEAIHPTLLAAGERFDVHLQYWHGWTPEIWMTIGVAGVGTGGVLLYRRLKLQNRPWSNALNANLLYDGGLRLLDGLSRQVTDRYMTGSIRRYLVYIFVCFIGALGITLLWTGQIGWSEMKLAPVSAYETIVVCVMVVAALAIPWIKNRIAAILVTGAVGYMVTLLFVLYRAPDLALTQMIVETVSVALFLLCFYHLPKNDLASSASRGKWLNLTIAGGAGFIVTLIVIGASGPRNFESISSFFVQESYRLGGGKNMVNVILVDFRGFDTLLEITVLGIASLGIYSMIRLRLAETKQRGEMRGNRLPLNGMANYRSNDVILKTISKVVVFIIVAFSLYLFLAGHNNPGGGFIGALMTSAALVLLAVAFGLEVIEKVLPINFRLLTAAGLLIAALTGVGSFLFNVPFLSHTFGHFELPLLGDTELATAVLFDLGVYLAVVGVTMTIILTIGKEER